jgi:GAF domain-containing protein
MNTTEKHTKYQLLIKQLHELIVPGLPAAGNICNLLGQMKQELDLFWVGLYMRQGNRLGLGAFQGLPACTLISLGRGVCGTSAEQAKTIIVDNVEDFPGYIACHSEARSEIVVPGFKNGQVNFVLDVDSVKLAAFDEVDQEYLEQIVKIFEELVD